nr:A24 family peptidase [Panacagrimonas sp.]
MGSAIVAAALAAWSAAVAWGDWRTRRIPNLLLLGAAAPVLAMLALQGQGPLGAEPMDSAVGAGIAAAMFLPGFVLGHSGGGDVKFAACCGLILGWPGTLPMLLLSAILLGAISLWVMMRRRGASASKGRIPAGPALALSFVLAMALVKLGMR